MRFGVPESLECANSRIHSTGTFESADSAVDISVRTLASTFGIESSDSAVDRFLDFAHVAIFGNAISRSIDVNFVGKYTRCTMRIDINFVGKYTRCTMRSRIFLSEVLIHLKNLESFS